MAKCVVEAEGGIEEKACGRHYLAEVRFVIVTGLAQFLPLSLPCTILVDVRAAYASVMLLFPWGLTSPCTSNRNPVAVQRGRAFTPYGLSSSLITEWRFPQHCWFLRLFAPVKMRNATLECVYPQPRSALAIGFTRDSTPYR